MHLERGTEEYKRVALMTAGPVKSHEMLAEHALFLLNKSVLENTFEYKIQIQNIVSQLQSSLNLKWAPGRDFHKMLALIWDSVEVAALEDYPKIQHTLGQYKNLLESLQKMPQ